jgi:hypothetical protein
LSANNTVIGADEFMDNLLVGKEARERLSLVNVCKTRVFILRF